MLSLKDLVHILTAKGDSGIRATNIDKEAVNKFFSTGI